MRGSGEGEKTKKQEVFKMFPVKSNDFPFNALGRLFDEALVATRRESTLPSVNISEDERAYHVALAAPGMRKEDFEVHVSDGVLSIGVEKEEKKEEHENCNGKEGKKCIVREYNYSSFHRSFGLPEDVDSEKVEASYENGELKVILPKRSVDPNEGKRQISVK